MHIVSKHINNNKLKKTKKMTKKMIVTLLLISASVLLAYSQERVNNYFIGGSLGFDFSDSQTAELDSKTISLSTALITGYHITNNIAAGLDFEYNITNTDYEDNEVVDYSDNSVFLIAPFFRYYIVSGLYAQGQVNIGYMNSEVKFYFYDPVSLQTTPMISKFTYMSYGYSLGLGYDIKLKENIYLEPMLRYLSNKLKDQEDNNDFKQGSFSFNIGLIVFL